MGVNFSLSNKQTIGSLQKKYSIGSFELLSKTAPIQALSLLMFGPFIDYYLSGKLITTYKMSTGAIVSTLLSLSLSLSLFLNLTLPCLLCCVQAQKFNPNFEVTNVAMWFLCSYSFFFHALSPCSAM